MTNAGEYLRRWNKLQTPVFLCHRPLAIVKLLVIYLVFWLHRNEVKSFHRYLCFPLKVISPNEDNVHQESWKENTTIKPAVSGFYSKISKRKPRQFWYLCCAFSQLDLIMFCKRDSNASDNPPFVPLKAMEPMRIENPGFFPRWY